MAELVVGALLGTAVSELLRSVKDARTKISSFEPILKRLESTLVAITPRLHEITLLNQKLDLANHHSGIADLISLVRDGKELVVKCSKIYHLNYVKKVQYSKLLLDLDTNLLRYFVTVLQLDQLKDTKEILVVLKELRCKFHPVNTDETLGEIEDETRSVIPGEIKNDSCTDSKGEILKIYVQESKEKVGEIMVEMKDRAEGSSSLKSDETLGEIEDEMRSINTGEIKFDSKGKNVCKEPIVVQTPTQTPTIVGPYGCQFGVCWDDGSHNSVRQILIVVGNCVESIQIEYDDDDKPQKHGGHGTYDQHKIRLDYPDEFLISVSGYYHANRMHIMSLTFHSNVRFYGPYGREGGVYFTFPSTGGKIIGFHGRCSECLSAIGAYYENCDKNNESKSGNSVKNGVVGDRAEIPISVGPFGGDAGSPWNDGVYTTIRQLVVSNSDSGINSIHVEYDKNGSSEWSEEHGDRVQSGINTVNLDYPNEFLIAISGFYSSESVQGLTFQTNKKSYGPFGMEVGKHFSTPSTGGKIVGFHGHCDINLVSIGAYFEPIVYSYSKTPISMSVGPFGGRGGSLFNDENFTGVRRLTIASGWWIDSISIDYDCNGSSVRRLHGGSGGQKNPPIILDYPNEFLISAWGYIYKYDTMVIIGSLTLQSNRKTYGPYGIEQGKKFSFPSTGGKIIGFHGKSGLYLDAIGAYLEPTTQNSFLSKNPARLENASGKLSSSTSPDEICKPPSA